MKLREYFASEPVNTGRQLEVDLLKGFAILFMVWVHVVQLLCSDESTLAYKIVYDVLGSPYAAPMFMISLGIGVCYSRRKSAARLAFRGLSIFLVGLALNAARYCATSWIGLTASGRSYSFEGLFLDLFCGDILQFAAPAFLFLAVARKWKWSLRRMVLFGVAASLAGWALRWRATGNVYADTLLGWVWATNEYSTFPFLGWIIFPIAGVCIGEAMLRCRDKHSVYLRLSPICLLVGTGYVAYSFITRGGYLTEASNYFFLTTIDAFFIIVLAIGLLGQNALLAHLLKGWRFPVLTRLSRNINAVYCIHWTLLMHFILFTRFVLPVHRFSFVQCTVITLVLLAVSDLLAALYAAKIRPALHAPTYMARQQPMWQPVFRLIRRFFPCVIAARSLRLLNAVLFSGGVSVDDHTKD